MLRSVSTRLFSTSRLVASEIKTQKAVNDLFSEQPEEKRRHAFSINKVELVGGVAVDPIYRTGKNNKSYLLFNLITNHSFKTHDGNYVDQTERHTVTVFGNRAEELFKSIKKGNRLNVQGRLHYSGGQKDEAGNRTQRNTYIIANHVEHVTRPVSENKSE
ncbi:unnamed protein product [Caenorhabditis angaria]|uniref:Uncharacterized protein n=1 Tax=Caenorhabditis angaria TaxID=860376 RepID=A0A9P1MYH2_9PELO|nr:unnamed protein product [Caenorhabditis angaria]